jgi:hypothetical protein
MFRLAFDLWEKYRKEAKEGEDGEVWRSVQEWKDGLARLAGATMDRESKDDNGNVVSVGNPDWQRSILVPTFDPTGKPTGWSISSTRQTREAAFHYLVEKTGVKLPPPSSTKTKRPANGQS